MHENHSTVSSIAQDAASNRRRAYELGERLLVGGSAAQYQYYRFLVRTTGSKWWDAPTYPQLAAEHQRSVRQVQRWDDHLVQLGLIWLEPVGRQYRRHVTALSPLVMPPALDDEAAIAALEPVDGPAPVSSLSPQEQPVQTTVPLSFLPDDHDMDVVINATSMSSIFSSTINNQHDQPTGRRSPLRPPRGNGGGGSRSADTPAVLRLRQEGVRHEGHLSEVASRNITLEEVTNAIRATNQRKGSLTSRPGFILHLLGVPAAKQGASAGGIWIEPPADPSDTTKYEEAAKHNPSFCPTCYRPCQPEWEGHCPRCEPELFEPTYEEEPHAEPTTDETEFVSCPVCKADIRECRGVDHRW